jgi:hypothetical protein
MSSQVRCPSTNTAIGEYTPIYMALRDHLNKNPPKKGEKQLIDYLHEFGLTEYPQLMRATTAERFIDGANINKEPQKNSR